MAADRDNREIEIDLVKLLHVLWSRALIIILAAAISGALTFAATFFLIKPKYEATASLYVNNSSYNYNSTDYSISSSEITASNSLVPVYIFILESRTTLENVINAAGLSYDYETLSEMITAQAVTGTAAFTVTVESESPSEAELIANTIAKILPDRISEIVDGSSVRILDYAIVPSHRASPDYIKNTVIGIVLGFIIAAVAVSVKYAADERVNDAILTADELRELFPEYPVLALIPDMTLRGKKDSYSYSYYNYKK